MTARCSPLSAVVTLHACLQGELPANMKQSWRFLLRKSLPHDSLVSVTYAVFGLGDSGTPIYDRATSCWSCWCFAS